MPLSGYTQHGGGGTQFGSVWRCEGCLPTGDFDAEARRRRGRGGGAAGESKPESAEPGSSWTRATTVSANNAAMLRLAVQAGAMRRCSDQSATPQQIMMNKPMKGR